MRFVRKRTETHSRGLSRSEVLMMSEYFLNHPMTNVMFWFSVIIGAFVIVIVIAIFIYILTTLFKR